MGGSERLAKAVDVDHKVKLAVVGAAWRAIVEHGRHGRARRYPAAFLATHDQFDSMVRAPDRYIGEPFDPDHETIFGVPLIRAPEDAVVSGRYVYDLRSA